VPDKHCVVIRAESQRLAQYPELEEEVSTVKSSPKKGKKSALESYTINLCEKAKAGGIDPDLSKQRHGCCSGKQFI
jgi:ATP-dependent Clp protease ATP-binding subunit ClpA